MPSRGLTLTLTTNGTPYNLLALIQAVAGYANTRPSCRELTLTGDAGNMGSYVYVGGSDVTTTNFGIQLQAGQSQTFRSTLNDVSLGDIWLLSDGDDVGVNVAWMEY